MALLFEQWCNNAVIMAEQCCWTNDVAHVYDNVVQHWRGSNGCWNRRKQYSLIEQDCSLLLSLFHCSILLFSHSLISNILSCMNNAVDLSWWFQQRCSSLSVQQATNNLFRHTWTSLSTTLFKPCLQVKTIKLCVFSCLSHEYEFWEKSHPQMSYNYDFITSARDGARN